MLDDGKLFTGWPSPIGPRYVSAKPEDVSKVFDIKMQDLSRPITLSNSGHPLTRAPASTANLFIECSVSNLFSLDLSYGSDGLATALRPNLRIKDFGISVPFKVDISPPRFMFQPPSLSLSLGKSLSISLSPSFQHLEGVVHRYQPSETGFSAAIETYTLNEFSVHLGASLHVELPGSIRAGIQAVVPVIRLGNEMHIRAEQWVHSQKLPDGSAQDYAGCRSLQTGAEHATVLEGLLMAGSRRSSSSELSLAKHVDPCGGTKEYTTWKQHDSQGNHVRALYGLFYANSETTNSTELNSVQEISPAGDWSRQSTSLVTEKRSAAAAGVLGVVSFHDERNASEIEEHSVEVRGSHGSPDMQIIEKHSVSQLSVSSTGLDLALVGNAGFGIGWQDGVVRSSGGLLDHHSHYGDAFRAFDDSIWAIRRLLNGRLGGTDSVSVHHHTSETRTSVESHDKCSRWWCQTWRCTTTSSIRRHERNTKTCQQILFWGTCKTHRSIGVDQLPAQQQCVAVTEYPTELYTGLRMGTLSLLGALLTPLISGVLGGAPVLNIQVLLIKPVFAFVLSTIQFAVALWAEHALLGSILGSLASTTCSVGLAALHSQPPAWRDLLVLVAVQCAFAVIAVYVPLMPLVHPLVPFGHMAFRDRVARAITLLSLMLLGSWVP